mmetsp:Transcript_40767/g.57327  ORF Transcript_40767/g.57327 Transcript_40767/m.57327 type:complete len:281 (-) Transcript_40767:606-1448(-)
MSPSLPQQDSNKLPPYPDASAEISKLMSTPIIASPSVMSIFTPGAPVNPSIFFTPTKHLPKGDSSIGSMSPGMNTPVSTFKEVAVLGSSQWTTIGSPGKKNDTITNSNCTFTKSAGASTTKNTTAPSPSKPTACTCPRTRCLKLYCVCFEAGVFCQDDCKCNNCKNYDGSKLLKTARKLVLEKRGPKAFARLGWTTPEGCRCKKNRCLKKYCQCFSQNVECNHNCYCTDCENFNPAERSSPKVQPTLVDRVWVNNPKELSLINSVKRSSVVKKKKQLKSR